jgi:hypothetical protein
MHVFQRENWLVNYREVVVTIWTDCQHVLPGPSSVASCGGGLQGSIAKECWAWCGCFLFKSCIEEEEIYICTSRLGLIKLDHHHSGNGRISQQ